MSLILDALKKLDREKSTRRDRTTNIAADILGADLPRPGKRISLYVATVFLTAVAATVITYAVIVHLGFRSKSSSPSSVRHQAAGGQVASVLPSREPVRDPMGRVPPSVEAPAESKTSEIKSPAESRRHAPAAVPPFREPVRADPRKMGRVSPGIQVPAEIKKTVEIQLPAENRQTAPAPPFREPVREDRDEPGQGVPKVQKPVEIKKPAENQSPAEIKKSVTIPSEKKASQPVLSGKGDIAPRSAEKISERAPGLSASASPSLKISGIVWHEEPSKRLAVINGMVTNEGSVIEGVKVLEIFPDRVRFSQEGLPFEIPFR